MRSILASMVAMMAVTPALAQRTTDIIDRALVAVPATSGSGNLVSWRVLAPEYYDVTYNLYANGSLIASGLSASNYQHTAGNSATTYQVAPVVKGVEQMKSEPVTRWSGGMLSIPVQAITGRDGTDVTSHYALNDISLGDLDGDGIVEFIVKRPCDMVTDLNNKNAFHVLDAYHRNGKRLWWIDLGPNMLSGADEQWDCVSFDWDQDGKAEVLLRVQDGAVIHYADGTTQTIGSSTVDTRWDGIEYTSSGNEYLLYLNGETGKPYQIGPEAHPDYMTYPLQRGSDSDWGSGIVGHRSTKHFFGAPYLDGRKASIFLGRGAYTKHKMAAFDVDPVTHQLTKRWEWENSSSSSPWFGQGYHNFSIGDVDWDGRDEIVFGSMVIDDNGKGLSTTGLGHGDAQHTSDFDPYRKYMETFACNESQPANNYRNTVTSEFYYRQQGSGDDGRALMGNFTNDYPGSVGRSVGSGWISSVADKVVTELNGDAFIGWGDLNQRIYWDGDLLDEYFDSPGTEGYGAIYKPTSKTTSGGRWNFPDSKCCNWSKNNPGAIADIFGDWREELVMRKSDNTAILVYSTGITTQHRLPSLWTDHQYRNAMVWQSIGYNQPPHKSYFVGEMEGITQAPPPLTMEGRSEIANGGTISGNEGHLIVCEMGDSKVQIAEGSSPDVVTFYVPSHVEGSVNSNTTSKNATINYTTHYCEVTGGGLAGTARLVKQGDGVLTLPAVAMNHTGNTDVWGGSLYFDGTMLKSPLWLNRFAELVSAGGHFRSIKAEYGAVIRPGSYNGIGTITVDETLDMGFGSRLILHTTGGVISSINAKTLAIETKDWEYGPKYLQPVVELAGDVQEGEYVIGNVETVQGNLADIKIEGQGDYKVALSHDDGKLILKVSGVREAGSIVWTGVEGNLWDYASTPNFRMGEATEEAEIFVAGDNVTFSDAAMNKNVELKGELAVGTITVDNTQAYTFTGQGSIVSGSFEKKGSGSVTINNDNTYTGGNRISGGTVIVKSLASATQAYGALGGVTTATSKFVIENGATLRTTAAVQNGSLVHFSSEQGGVIQNDAAFTQQRAFTGSLFTKRGTGYMTMQQNNTSLTKLVVAGGTVEAPANPAKSVEIQNATLNVGTGSTSPIYVPKGRNATLNYQGDRGSFSNAVTGEGTLSVSYPLVKGSTWVATRATLNGDWSQFAGTLKPVSGIASDGRFCINNSKGMPLGTMDIASGVKVQTPGMTYTIGRVTGNGSLDGPCSFNSNSYSNCTWVVGDDTDFTFRGTVTGSAIFRKVGMGTMTVSGSWTTTQPLTVAEGELKVTSTASLGTGRLTIAKGASLTGTISARSSLKNSSVTVNGTLRPSSTDASLTGTMYFNNQEVIIGETGSLRLNARRASTQASPLGANDLSGTTIKNVKKLTLNGRIEINMVYMSGNTPAVGDTLHLWDSSVAEVSGTPTVVSTDGLYTFDASRISEGKVVITAIATGIANIAAHEQVGAQLFSTDGVAVYSVSATYGELPELLQRTQLPHGTYVLRIKSNAGVVTRKHIVK